jgi:hypothetical protein
MLAVLALAPVAGLTLTRFGGTALPQVAAVQRRDTSIQLKHLFEQRLDGIFRSMGGSRGICHVRVSSHTTVAIGERLFGFGIHHRSQRFLYERRKRYVCIFNNRRGGREIRVIKCMPGIRKRDQLGDGRSGGR